MESGLSCSLMEATELYLTFFALVMTEQTDGLKFHLMGIGSDFINALQFPVSVCQKHNHLHQALHQADVYFLPQSFSRVKLRIHQVFSMLRMCPWSIHSWPSTTKETLVVWLGFVPLFLFSPLCQRFSYLGSCFLEGGHQSLQIPRFLPSFSSHKQELIEVMYDRTQADCWPFKERAQVFKNCTCRQAAQRHYLVDIFFKGALERHCGHSDSSPQLATFERLTQFLSLVPNNASHPHADILIAWSDHM